EENKNTESAEVSENSQSTAVKPVQMAIKGNDTSSIGDNSAETILAIVAYLISAIGVIASIVAGYILINGFDEDHLKMIGWVVLIGGIIVSLIIWASLMILVNISNNIRHIKHELQEDRVITQYEKSQE
ncbi:MAG: hypothetical protein K2H32_00140, partial [Muribaculaceae bacterium]|nr:hypothetical protein [Muribaculaceae bacterium]